MACPASTKTLRSWLDEIDQKAAVLKQQSQAQFDVSLAGNLDMDQVRRYFDTLVSYNVFFNSAGVVPGLASYVNAEKQGQVADAAAQFVVMQAALVAVLDWLRANVPSAVFGSGTYKLAYTFPIGNTTVSTPLKYTAAETANYRTVLTTLIATIS